jgi:hypothetical protein
MTKPAAAYLLRRGFVGLGGGADCGGSSRGMGGGPFGLRAPAFALGREAPSAVADPGFESDDSSHSDRTGIVSRGLASAGSGGGRSEVARRARVGSEGASLVSSQEISTSMVVRRFGAVRGAPGRGGDFDGTMEGYAAPCR